MRIIQSLGEMNETARGWLSGGMVGFVPTMGYLHDGHLSLIRAAQECEITVVSIFVNPLQFAPGDNPNDYPKDIQRDLRLLRAANVDAVFIPRAEDIFPPDFTTYVTLTGPIDERLEGTICPGYIRGVATISAKLFQLVRPDVAYFGQKNAQQVAVVRQLVRDLNIDVTLRVLPTVRENDGLALGSHNYLLSLTEREAAQVLYRALLAGKVLIDGGERRPLVIEQAMANVVASVPLVRLDYTAVCRGDTFSKVPAVTPGTLLALAVHIGSVRLIDNFLYKGDGQWLL
jgi:pantoate--beta-alanine ligase